MAERDVPWGQPQHPRDPDSYPTKEGGSHAAQQPNPEGPKGDTKTGKD